MRITARWLGALAILAINVACGKGGDTKGDMEASVNAMSQPVAPDTLGKAALTDPNIVAILDGANMADSSMAAMANRRTNNADIKTFARMMMGEHNALRVSGRDLAAKLGVTPQLPTGDQGDTQHRAAMQELEAAGAADFDRMYLTHEVEYHEWLLATATSARAAAQNEELRNLLDTAIPVVQKHLDEARRLQAKLSQ